MNFDNTFLRKLKTAYQLQKFNCDNKVNRNGKIGRYDRNGDKIEFKLTFEEWLRIWIDSGHLHERGRKKGQYVMSRKNDIGHYEVGNVFIQLCSENNRNVDFSNRARPFLTEEQRQKKSLIAKENFTGKTRSPEHCRKISEKAKGRKQSPETIEKRREKMIGRKQSPETIQKRKESNFRTDEWRRNMSAAKKGKKRNLKKIKCSVCGSEHPKFVISRWHNSKCKT